MKKALLAALCFVLVGFMLVNGTFALPDLSDVFQTIIAWGNDGVPEDGNTTVDVTLISDNAPQSLIPGGKASRTYRVQNTGEGPVYFRLVYAIQYDAESWDHLTINFDAGQGFIQHEGWKDIRVSGTPYKMKVFTYSSALLVNAGSSEVTISIAMDAAVTNEDLSRYRSDFLQAQVLAIDPTPFTEKGYTYAQAALDLALPLENLNPF